MRFAFLRLGILAFLSTSGAIAHAAPDPRSSPCRGEFCDSALGDDIQRLNDAYLSGATSDAERTKMAEIIAAHTANGSTNWSVVASEYFAWRATTLHYLQPPPGGQASAPVDPAEAVRRAEAQEREDQLAFREAGEAAVRAQLVDPGSAQFEWPYKFVNGYWKPFLEKRVQGYVTCGFVNARNRMGGYAGRSAFVVVLSAERTPLLVNMDSGTDKYGLIGAQCEKAASTFLPPAPIEDAVAKQNSPQTGSVADELEKLAGLRERGIITPAEFDAQKAKLLGEK